MVLDLNKSTSMGSLLLNRGVLAVGREYQDLSLKATSQSHTKNRLKLVPISSKSYPLLFTGALIREAFTYSAGSFPQEPISLGLLGQSSQEQGRSELHFHTGSVLPADLARYPYSAFRATRKRAIIELAIGDLFLEPFL